MSLTFYPPMDNVILFKSEDAIKWPWLKKYHLELWELWYDGLLTKYEVFLSIVGKII